MTKTESRSWGIDIARAIAMLLVVYEHLLRCYAESLLPLMSEQTMHSVIHGLTFFHMPTFFILAGFCLAKSSKTIDSGRDYGIFEWKKFRRLMVPYIIVCVVQLAAGIAAGIRSVGDIPSEFYKAFVFPVAGPAGHGWFLVALMSIFIVWPVLKFIFRGNAVLIFAAAALLDIYRESIAGYLDLDVFQIGILITYLPVFAFGAVICRTNREKLLSFEPLTFAATAFLGAALAALCISLKTTSLLETSPLRPFIYDIASLGGKIFGGVAVIKLSVIIARLLEKTGAFFAHLGRYSYDIYLYHILTLMIMITIVDKLNLSPSLTKAAASAVFIGAVAAAYAGCRIIRMNKRLSSVILGDPV